MSKPNIPSVDTSTLKRKEEALNVKAEQAQKINPVSGPSNEKTLEEKFLEFERETSEFSETESEEKSEGVKKEPEKIYTNSQPFAASNDQKQKVKIIFGYLFFLVDGFHAFIYDKVSSLDISRQDLALSESQRASLEPYLYTQEIIDFIEKYFKGWVMLLLQTEYFYFMNFQNLKRKNKDA